MNRMTYRGGRGEMGTIPGGPLGKARFALGSGRPDEAERLMRKRLERYPDDVNARVLLAQALLQQQMTAEAASEARRATRQQSTNVDAQLVLSSALLQSSTGPLAQFSKVPPEALAAAKRAVQLQPKVAKTHVQLAEVYMAQREMASARAEIDEAIRLEPRLAGAHLMRAVILMSDKDPEGAVQESDAALRYDRTLTQAEFIKANALLDVKRYDEALASLDTAERTNPAMFSVGNTRALRGRIYFKQRKFKQSYGQFLQAQMMSGRLKRLAPALAGMNMVLAGLFGQNASIALAVVLIVIVLAILFGLSFIPVAGNWIVAVLVLGILGVVAFGYVRQSQGGRLLPAAINEKVTTIVAIVAAGLFGVVIAGVIIGLLSINVFHFKGSSWITPFTIFIAGVVGVALAAFAAYLWLKATRAGRGSAGAAA